MLERNSSRTFIFVNEVEIHPGGYTILEDNDEKKFIVILAHCSSKCLPGGDYSFQECVLEVKTKKHPTEKKSGGGNKTPCHKKNPEKTPKRTKTNQQNETIQKRYYDSITAYFFFLQ